MSASYRPAAIAPATSGAEAGGVQRVLPGGATRVVGEHRRARQHPPAQQVRPVAQHGLDHVLVRRLHVAEIGVHLRPAQRRQQGGQHRPAQRPPLRAVAEAAEQRRARRQLGQHPGHRALRLPANPVHPLARHAELRGGGLGGGGVQQHMVPVHRVVEPPGLHPAMPVDRRLHRGTGQARVVLHVHQLDIFHAGRAQRRLQRIRPTHRQAVAADQRQPLERPGRHRRLDQQQRRPHHRPAAPEHRHRAGHQPRIRRQAQRGAVRPLGVQVDEHREAPVQHVQQVLQRLRRVRQHQHGDAAGHGVRRRSVRPAPRPRSARRRCTPPPSPPC